MGRDHGSTLTISLDGCHLFPQTDLAMIWIISVENLKELLTIQKGNREAEPMWLRWQSQTGLLLEGE